MSNVFLLPVFFILFGSSYGVQWAYTTSANTTDGRPCLTDCIDKTCIVDWSENRMSCINDEHDYVAPKYRTAEYKDKSHKYCLSNCGFFGWEFQWCVTANDKTWDYCNSGDSYVSAYKHSCKEGCEKWNENYYWCYVEGGSWDYCAPPREKTSYRRH